MRKICGAHSYVDTYTDGLVLCCELKAPHGDRPHQLTTGTCGGEGECVITWKDDLSHLIRDNCGVDECEDCGAEFKEEEDQPDE
jgi:hypothetical protein